MFCPENDITTTGLVRLYTACTEIFDLFMKLDATQSFAQYSTNYYQRTVLLAACCILRIMRSRLREVIDMNDAEQSVFKAINFFRNRLTQTFDLDARYAIIIQQLYSSRSAFKTVSGEINGLHLDIRSRLVSISLYPRALSAHADSYQLQLVYECCFR